QHFDLTPHIRYERGIEQHIAKSDLNHEYPSLIQTFFDTHTHDGVFAQDDARIKYDEMVRLRDLGANMPLGRPYTEDEIMAQAEIDEMLSSRDKTIDEGKEEQKREIDLLRRVVMSDERMSQSLGWSDMAGSDRLWPGLAGYDRVWPGFGWL
ncbi:hypothetical protein Tco_0040204, partial [Tanacetum coccineum]